VSAGELDPPSEDIARTVLAARRKRPRLPRAERRDRQNRNFESIEEEFLASYLAGTLTSQQRAEVVRYLATHPDALEILSMAYEAMAAERRTR
jgi:hypothetical protein